jgi:hypothetical protein
VAPADVAALWAGVLHEAPPLVLVTAECAAALPPEVLDAALARLAPPVVVVADAGHRVALPDLLPRVRASLGISAPEDGAA